MLHLDLLDLLVAVVGDIAERLNVNAGEERHFDWILSSVGSTVSILLS